MKSFIYAIILCDCISCRRWNKTFLWLSRSDINLYKGVSLAFTVLRLLDKPGSIKKLTTINACVAIKERTGYYWCYITIWYYTYSDWVYFFSSLVNEKNYAQSKYLYSGKISICSDVECEFFCWIKHFIIKHCLLVTLNNLMQNATWMCSHISTQKDRFWTLAIIFKESFMNLVAFVPPHIRIEWTL